MVSYNWKKLIISLPMKFSKLIEHISIVEDVIKTEMNKSNLGEAKEKLMNAKAEIEIILHDITTKLYDYSILTSDVDKGLYIFLKDDITGFLGILDEKQNKYLEVMDGIEKIGTARVSAFKNVLKEALYGVIWASLEYASKEYNNIKPNEEIKKELRTFLRILFLVLSINMSIAGGIPRRKALGITGSQALTRPFLPASWKSMFTKESEDMIKQEYKNRYGEELPKELPEEMREESDYMPEGGLDEDF